MQYLISVKRLLLKWVVKYIHTLLFLYRDILYAFKINNNKYEKVLVVNNESKYFNKGPHNYCHFILGHLYQLYLQWQINPWKFDCVNYDFLGIYSYHSNVYKDLTYKNPSIFIKKLTFNIKKPNKLFYNRIIYLKNMHNLMSKSPSYPNADGFHNFVIESLNISENNVKFLTLIERPSNSDRSIINHIELKNALEILAIKYGLKFLNVKLEKYKEHFRDQVDLVYNSKIFIGQHGAAFANLFFVNKKSISFEILSSEYKRFHNIAVARKLNYHEIRVSPTNKRHPKNSHINLDVNSINSILETQLIKDSKSFSNYSSF